MKVQVALVPLDESYLQDRVIARLKGGQKYGHAAFVITKGGEEPVWLDVHWRWFATDLRVIPAKNYGWKFELFDIENFSVGQRLVLYEWLKFQQAKPVRYDIIGAIYIALGSMFGCEPPVSPRSYTCFEFIARGLVAAGMTLGLDPETALASDLLGSGFLVPSNE